MSRQAPYRAVVVDDEPEARQVVTTFLSEEPRVQVVGEAGNGPEAVALVRKERPDLLFVDIQMPGMDGFAVVETLGDDAPAGIVFVTAHDEYALRAFDVHAMDYVLKPFGRPRFKAAVERALRRLGAEEALASMRTVAAVLGRRARPDQVVGELTEGESATAPPHPRRIGVRIGSRLVLVPVEDIDWAEADGDYVRVVAGGAAHLVSSSLQAMERALGAGRFFRVHRSVVANLDRVRELHREPNGGGYLVLDGGVRLRVSRGRWDPLVQALGVEG